MSIRGSVNAFAAVRAGIIILRVVYWYLVLAGIMRDQEIYCEIKSCIHKIVFNCIIALDMH